MAAKYQHCLDTLDCDMEKVTFGQEIQCCKKGNQDALVEQMLTAADSS